MNSPGPDKKHVPPLATPADKPSDTRAQLIRESSRPAKKSTPTKKSSPLDAPKNRGSVAKRRRNARQKAMQALYQWEFDSEANSVTGIIEQFCELQNMERVDVEYFKEVFLFASKNLDAVDGCIADYIDRPIESLDPVERSVLRVACSELMCRLDTPYKVVVNEALEITKLFGADQGHKFVNGVVDKMAAQHRAVEYQAGDSTSSDPS